MSDTRKLRVNDAKIKVMRWSRDGGLGGPDIVLDAEILEQEAFQYLGMDTGLEIHEGRDELEGGTRSKCFGGIEKSLEKE